MICIFFLAVELGDLDMIFLFQDVSWWKLHKMVGDLLRTSKPNSYKFVPMPGLCIPIIHPELKAFPAISRNCLYFQDELGDAGFDKYGDVRDALWRKGLIHSFLFIDGQRTVKEIYDAVQSELWSGGYTSRYHVSFKIMTNYFRMLKDKVIILFKE